jgi:hypothetical protein
VHQRNRSALARVPSLNAKTAQNIVEKTWISDEGTRDVIREPGTVAYLRVPSGTVGHQLEILLMQDTGPITSPDVG